MNIQLNPTQSDTKAGDINLIANVDLTGLEGYVCKIIDVNGVPQAALPTAQSDIALYVVDSGDIAGNNVSIEAPSNTNFRAVAAGAGAAGSVIILAGAGSYGKVIADPATGGTLVFSVGISEEAFVVGQLVKIRPFPRLIQH
jgi:hypothetical protein